MDKTNTQQPEHPDDTPQFPISVVEQETGISKELLRMWERRYGFPVPTRDAAGNRLYSRRQILRLHDINRLLGAGYRPGFVVGADPQRLERLLREIPSPATSSPRAHPALDKAWKALAEIDLRGLRHLLRQELAREGAQNWVMELAAPLLHRMARSRLDESLPTFVERAAQELLLETLELAAAQIPPAPEDSLRILLMSLPGEGRPLELQMTRILLLGKGVDVLFLGPEPPLEDVLPCLQHCPVHVVQLAISAASVNGDSRQWIRQIQDNIPPSISLWLSGSGAAELKETHNGPCFARLQELLSAVEHWNPGNLG
ncbi:MerR family transcriptional regulator [Acidithiobacillus caldus]